MKILTRLLKFIKENWLSIGIIIILIIILRAKGTENREYKRDMKVLSDSIHVMDMEYRLRGDSLSYAVKMASTALKERAIYQDSIRILKISLRNLTYRHEIEMDNLRSIPSDSLYVEVTRWLNNLSFD